MSDYRRRKEYGAGEANRRGLSAAWTGVWNNHE